MIHPFMKVLTFSNKNKFACLHSLPHLLIAGATGSGKSVFSNSLIITLLLTVHPSELRMILIDPKGNEMIQYKDIPHVDVIAEEIEESIEVLESLCIEMDKRYKMMAEIGVRNIRQYNDKAKEKMPFIVCLIDEYADLMATNKEVEKSVIRISQKARAAGIHLIVATQKQLQML